MNQKRPYHTPFECPACHLTHQFKTYHIDLDSDGFAIVSREIWEILQGLDNHGFSLMNEVEKPPPQRIAVGFAGSGRIIGTDGKEIVSGAG